MARARDHLRAASAAALLLALLGAASAADPTRVVLVCGQDDYCFGAKRGADAAIGNLPGVALETVAADDKDP